MQFIHGDIHAWDSNGKILVSDESTKQLRSFDSTDDAINWLFLTGSREAARALNKEVKQS